MDWTPIDPAAPPDHEVLLYFPAVTLSSGRMRNAPLRKVGCFKDFPFRKPTHYAEVPSDPPATTT